MKRNAFVVAVIGLVLAFALAAWWYRERRAERLGFLANERAEIFVRPHAPVLGAADARVYLVEFTDPACETCATFAPAVKQLVDRYEGKLRLVVRWAPFHEGSIEAVRILEAARLQGRFWETLDLLFRTQQQWTRHHHVYVDELWPLLPEIGLDVDRLRRDIADPRIAALIEQDLADAQALGVQRTPGFFVNGKPLEPFGYEPLLRLVAAEVRESYPD